MTTKTWAGATGAIAVVSLVTVVGGCMKTADNKEPCDRAHDCIPIFVDSSTGTPKIKLNAIDENYQRSGNGAIWWKIDPSASAYTFANNDAISFSLKGGADDPNGVFSNCMVMQNTSNKTFKCSADSKKGKYGYTITLAGLPPVLPYDPFVVNN